jgi:hypothetical protein
MYYWINPPCNEMLRFHNQGCLGVGQSEKKNEMLPFISPCTSWFLSSTLWCNGSYPHVRKIFQDFFRDQFSCIFVSIVVNIGYFKAMKIIMKF